MIGHFKLCVKRFFSFQLIKRMYCNWSLNHFVKSFCFFFNLDNIRGKNYKWSRIIDFYFINVCRQVIWIQLTDWHSHCEKILFVKIISLENNGEVNGLWMNKRKTNDSRCFCTVVIAINFGLILLRSLYVSRAANFILKKNSLNHYRLQCVCVTQAK